MKRFYCKTCKRVKRVRRLPKNVAPAEKPTDRIGFCDKHGVRR